MSRVWRVRRGPRAGARGVVGVVTAASLLAGVAVAATARPVAAADGLGTYTVTFAGTAAGRGGGVGASGGLVSFSGGPADVSGRLDAAPSSAAQASSIEPGTMWRLVAGQVNDQAGEQVIGEPTTARAEFPGEVTEDDATQAAPDDTGPLQVVGGQGRAVAAAARAVAEAATARLAVAGEEDAPPVLRIAGSYADARADVDEAGARVQGRVEVGVERLEVADQLVLEDVVGTVAVTAEDDERTADADLVVGSVTVAGTPVVVGEEGVVVAEEAVLPGTEADTVTEQLNAALEAAGITIRLLGAREVVEDTRAVADSGGIGIRVTTPATQGVPRNDLELVVGRATTTVFAEPARAPLDSGTAIVPSDDGAVDAGATTTDDDGGATTSAPTTGSASAPVPPATDVAVPAPSADPPAPQVAPEGAAEEPVASPPMVVAGRRMSARTAYAGFAAWLLFTSTIPMLGTAWLRRRGIA